MDPKEGEKKNEGAAGAGDKKEGGGGEGEKKFLTAEEAAEVVNKAITGHLKRAIEKIPKGLGPEELDAWWAKKQEEAEKKAAEAKAKAEEDAKAEKGKKGAGADAEEAVKKALDAAEKKWAERMKKVEADLEAERQKRADAEKKQQDASDRQTILEALEKSGATASKARIALNHLTSEGRIKRGEDGLVFVKPDGDEIEIKKGIADWIKTEEGKEFLPPTGSQGSGSGNTKGRAASKEMSAKTKAGLALIGLRGGGAEGAG